MRRETTVLAGAVAVAAGCCAALAAQDSLVAPLPSWRKIANSNSQIPGSAQRFGSFNQPAVNRHGVVVFRARSTGESQPISGVFMRRMASADQPIEAIALRTQEVPQPNNVESPPGSGELAGFNEFPSIPRIDADSELVGTRGNSMPVWEYLLPDGSETRVGTTGVYAWSGGELVTALSALGAVSDPITGEPTFPEYSVPGAPIGTRFDVFPGSPAIANGRFVVSKGNWTDPDTGLGKTGVFVRDIAAPHAPLAMLASSDTDIPGQGPVKVPVKFGSTAPPSAADGYAVFLAVDSEDAPTMGGLYAAPLKGEPALEPLVLIGDPIPGAQDSESFTRLGEAVAFDGRHIAFWGAWGSQMREITLSCPEDGNPDLIAYCHEQHPQGFTVEVPVHQGVFVTDIVTGATTMVAQTGSDAGDISDFVYWNFSGRVPGTAEGDDDGEAARWRSATFLAVESDLAFGGNGSGFRVGFKASVGETQAIYLFDGPVGTPPEAVVKTGDAGPSVDAEAPAGSVVTAVAIERESLRDGWFVVAVSMLDESTGESWAGIYSAGTRRTAGDFDGDGAGDVFWYSPVARRACFWHMDGIIAYAGGYTTVDPTADLVGQRVADLDGDGKVDVLWRDSRTNAFHAWLLDGPTVRAAATISGAIDPSWQLIATGDLDGDHRDDLVFRSSRTGEVRGWLMDGLVKAAGGHIGDSAGLEFCGSGDFDADGNMDLLWKSENGAYWGWTLRGLSITAGLPIANANPVSERWRVAAIGDTDGDLRDDVVWFNESAGLVAVWRMQGLRRIEGGLVGEPVDSAWSIVLARDFDGDGRDDLLWRNADDGGVAAWLMQGRTVNAAEFLRSAPLHWKPLP